MVRYAIAPTNPLPTAVKTCRMRAGGLLGLGELG